MAESSSEFDNLEEAKIWNNSNIFTKNIVFSKDQKFPIFNFDYANYPVGSMIFANGVSWDIIKPNLTNQFLSFTANGLQWQHLQFSNIYGVLPVSQGGTGWSILPEKGLLINSCKEVLDLLPFPKEFKILAGKDDNIEWIDFKTIVDEVSSKFKTINVVNNVATLNNHNPVLKLSDNMIASGLSFDSSKFNFSLSTNTANFGEYNSSFESLSFDLDLKNKKFIFNVNDFPVLTINENGHIDKCTINFEQIIGILPVSKGGLGPLQLKKGSLIYCSSENEINTITSENKEGFYLRVKDGIPQYVELDKSFLDGNLNVPLVLDRSRNELPPLRFQRSSLLENLIEGSLEFDGYNLFLTTAAGRKALSYMSSDISGKSSNVTGIVSLKNGGTGTDLEDISVGQIIIKNENILSSLEHGSYGQFLMSQGQGAFPIWSYTLNDIETNLNSGLNITRNGSSVNISLDQNFNPIWQGKHKFINDLDLTAQLSFTGKNKAPIKFDVTPKEVEKSSGELWFDGNELFFNTGSKIISLTNEVEVQEYKQSHLLTLSAGNEIFDNKKLRIKVPVPYLTTKKNLAVANWKIKYIHMVTDEPPTTEEASFKLFLNDKIISAINIPIGSSEFINSEFRDNILTSGEILQLECVKTGGSNFWSAFLMIEII